MKRALIFLVLLTALSGAAEVSRGDIAVFSRPEHPGLSRRALDAAEASLAEIKERLGLKVEGGITITLLDKKEDFDNILSPRRREQVLAVAYPAENRVLVDTRKLAALSDNNLRVALEHELAHLAIGGLKKRAGQGVPLWFEEGVCCWISPKVFHYEMDALLNAGARGSLIPLASLDAGLPEDGAAFSLAYAESESVVRFLARKHGEDAIRAVFRLMGEGKSFDEAFASAAGGATVRQLEDEWKESFRSPLLLLSAYFSPNHMLLYAALLTIVAFIVWRVRRARIMKKWKEEESSGNGWFFD